MSFSEQEVNMNREIINKILKLMEDEDITMNQAEKIVEMLPYEFEKNRKLLVKDQKFSVCKI